MKHQTAKQHSSSFVQCAIREKDRYIADRCKNAVYGRHRTYWSSQRRGFTLKTIIFSGYNEFEYAKLAVRLGVSDYILKPVNPQEFAQTIEKVTGTAKAVC